MARTRWRAGRDGVRSVNYSTGDTASFFYDLINQVHLNAAAIARPAAERVDTAEVNEKSDHWLIKFTEASFNGRR